MATDERVQTTTEVLNHVRHVRVVLKGLLGRGCEDPGCAHRSGRPGGVVEVGAVRIAESS